MIAVNIVCIFIVDLLQFSSAHFTARQGLLRADVGGYPLAHLMDDFEEKSQSKELQERTAALHRQAPSPMASALRLTPEYFDKLVAYFEYLDTDPADGKLSLLEFMKAAKYSEREEP